MKLLPFALDTQLMRTPVWTPEVGFPNDAGVVTARSSPRFHLTFLSKLAAKHSAHIQRAARYLSSFPSTSIDLSAGSDIYDTLYMDSSLTSHVSARS